MNALANDWTWAWPWWSVLVALNAVHVLIGLSLFWGTWKPASQADRFARTMALMGLVFVLVAGYRSVFVSSYLRQLAWFDSPLNGALLIRCFALCAELSFAGLIAGTLLRMNRDVPELIGPAGSLRAAVGAHAPVLFFFCIACANVCATSATITKIDLIFALEESFWGLGFVILMPTLVQRLRALAALRGGPAWAAYRPAWLAVVVLTVFSVGYGLFELGFNLPVIYWPNAIAQLQMAVPDPAFRFGWAAVADAFSVVNETKSLAAWGGMGFVVWHTGYFSICVWMVLFLMTAPRVRQR